MTRKEPACWPKRWISTYTTALLGIWRLLPCPNLMLGCILRRNSEEFRIFWYFTVIPIGTTLPYATRKRKNNEKERQRNVISASATDDLHTYFLRRSVMKSILLLKMHQRAAAAMGGIFRCHGHHSCSSWRSRPPPPSTWWWLTPLKYPLMLCRQSWTPPLAK